VDATNPNAVHIEMKRGLESGTRIKTEFVDGSTNGEFSQCLRGFD
jgi:hypothetical protein